jgi:hypothetical protein
MIKEIHEQPEAVSRVIGTFIDRTTETWPRARNSPSILPPCRG